MNMEKPNINKKKEAFIPKEKLEEFVDAKERAEYFKYKEGLAKILSKESKESAAKSKHNGIIAAGLATVGLNKEANLEEKKAKKYDERAAEARQNVEEAQNRSRGIVADEMFKTGASEVRDSNEKIIGGRGTRLEATPEQVEIAREEMNEDLNSRKQGEEEK